jgi:hypothetical protein
MSIHEITMMVEQYGGSFTDSEVINITMDDSETEELGRKVFLTQFEKKDDGNVEHLIFIDGKEALESVILSLQFILSQKGWSRDEL